jgi:hypothetical protein
LDRQFPDGPYAEVFAPSPCPEVWLFAWQGGKISETRFRQGEKNKNKTFFTAAAKPPQ